MSTTTRTHVPPERRHPKATPVTLDEARGVASLSTHRGCDLGCVFCQCASLGLTPAEGARSVATTAQILEALEERRGALEGATLHINDQTDPFLEDVVESTVSLVEALGDLDNPLLIISKVCPSARHLARLAVASRGRLKILICLADPSGVLERVSLTQRLALARAAADVGLPVGLLLRPLTPNWTCLAALTKTLPLFAAYISEVVLSGVRPAVEIDAALEAYGVHLGVGDGAQASADVEFEEAVWSVVRRHLPFTRVTKGWVEPQAQVDPLTRRQRASNTSTLFGDHDFCQLTPPPIPAPIS